MRGRQFATVVAPEETVQGAERVLRHMIGEEDIDAPVLVIDEDGDRRLVDVSSVCLYSGTRAIGVFGQLSSVSEEDEPEPHPHLTPRQAEVLRLLDRGYSTHQIADELQLSVETIRNHIRGVFRALGVHSRLEAVAVARTEHVLS